MSTRDETSPPLTEAVPAGSEASPSHGVAEDAAAYDRPMRDVPSPRRLAPLFVIAVGVVVCAVAAFSLSQKQTRPAMRAAAPEEIEYTTGVATDDLPMPRTETLPPPPARADGRLTSLASRPSTDERSADQLAEARRHAPVLILGGGRGGSADRVATMPETDPQPPVRSALLARPQTLSAGSATRAVTRLDTTLPEGAFIAATLETAIQSDLPGGIRAVVARDVYAADATRLLVPRGSRLIGEYRSGLVRGQSRVFAVWTRLVRPDGVSILLDARVTDGAGRSGATGSRDSHFFERFSAAVLLSLIDGAVTAVANDAGAREDARVVLQSGGDFSRAAEIALQNSIAIPPTIHVAPGTRLQVFVNRDIDFSSVIADAPSISAYP